MKKSTLGLCILTLMAWTWVLWLWIRHGLVHPMDIPPLILSDLEFLGPFAIILDIIILVCLYLVLTPLINRRRMNKEDSCLREPLDNKTDN